LRRSTKEVTDYAQRHEPLSRSSKIYNTLLNKEATEKTSKFSWKNNGDWPSTNLPRENNWTTTHEQSPSKQRDSQNPSNTSQKKRTKGKTWSWIPPLSRGSTKPSSKNPYSDGQQTPIIGEISTTEVEVADMDCEEDLTIEATRRIFPGKEKAPGRRREYNNSTPANTEQPSH
jgi:hypothetical protein